MRREELLAGKERELSRRDAALGGAEQRVGQLTRRLEADLKLSATPSAGATAGGSSSQLRGSFDTGFGSALNSASSMRTVTQGGAAAAASAAPSRLSGQQQQKQQPARSSQQAAASSSGTFATPANSLLQRSVTPEPQYQQQQAPASTTSTAAGGVAQRRDSFASLDGTPDRQASLGQALKQLQGATYKGATRWVGGWVHAWDVLGMSGRVQ